MRRGRALVAATRAAMPVQEQPGDPGFAGPRSSKGNKKMPFGGNPLHGRGRHKYYPGALRKAVKP